MALCKLTDGTISTEETFSDLIPASTSIGRRSILKHRSEFMTIPKSSFSSSSSSTWRYVCIFCNVCYNFQPNTIEVKVVCFHKISLNLQSTKFQFQFVLFLTVSTFY